MHENNLLPDTSKKPLTLHGSDFLRMLTNKEISVMPTSVPPFMINYYEWGCDINLAELNSRLINAPGKCGRVIEDRVST